MISNYFEIFILSLVQGVSEFLPISSSAHLILISNFFELNNQSLLIDISLHLGSLLAILFHFRNDIFNLNKNKNLFIKIIIGSLPLIIIGYFLYSSGLIYKLRNIKVIAWTTLIFAVLIYLADKNKSIKNINNDLNFKSIFFIGCFQILALIPGVSRSGISITASRILGFDRSNSVIISFYLSVPALLGASFLGLKDLINQNINFNLLAFFGVILSFIFSLIIIKLFLKFVQKFSLITFVIYRIVLFFILFLIIYV